MLGGRILSIGAEVAKAHKLECIAGLRIGQRALYLTAGEDFQRIGIQTGQEILSGGIGVRVVKQVCVLTDLSIYCGLRIHPVVGSALVLPTVSGITAPGIGILRCQDLGHIAVFVGNTAGALD